MAKEKAASSYQELMELRETLSESMQTSGHFSGKSDSSTLHSVQSELNSKKSSGSSNINNNNNNGSNSNNGNSTTTNNKNGGIIPDELSSSINETDRLLTLFRDSFTNLNSTSVKFSGGNAANTRSKSFGTSSVEESAEVSLILEKYSDRLLEMVTEKITSKSGGTGSSSSK